MKLVSLEINSFRGIPSQLVIDFPIKNGHPASLIILGDNGSGKSSIIDAIEFCLQGHIAQSKGANANFPSVLSYASKNLPSVSITLENGELVNRYIVNDEQGLLFNVKEPHNLFAISPFVLRRHDILRFIDAPDSERTLVFSNYLRKENHEWIELPTNELIRLQDERLRLKEERDKAIEKLAKELKISPDEIPFGTNEFHDFVKQHIYLGISKKQFEAKGIKVRINDKALLLSHEALKLIDEYRKLKSKVSKYSIDVEKRGFPEHLLPQLEEFLNSVAEKLTVSFLQISPIKYIDKISVEYSKKNVLALQIRIHLKNNKICNPKQILSEANLDLLALLFFLSFIQQSSDRGQSKFMILDDVLQSVDATIRVSFISYLLKNFSDWQFIVTAHDRLWHRQLNELMLLYNHQNFNVAITDWNFEIGPQLKQLKISLEESLNEAIKSGNVVTICSESGLLLEQICDTLSCNLNVSIQRKKDDRYTIADLWVGISKQLKKTLLKEKIEAVERWLHLRNLLGAHYNEWALSLSLEEAKAFGEAVIELLKLIKCGSCNTWLLAHPQFTFYSCKCGQLTYQKK